MILELIIISLFECINIILYYPGPHTFPRTDGARMVMTSFVSRSGMST